ncbi:MAG TPA: putative toxin-antitoxin system toxin component, PIN family [Burkholderiales bacterium]
MPATWLTKDLIRSSFAFDAALDRGKILISVPVLEELDRVLSREKFNRYVSAIDRNRFLVGLVREAEWVAITEAFSVCRDSKDNMFLELAVSGHANTIISGDSDLLALSPFRGVAVLNPEAFLSSIKSGK